MSYVFSSALAGGPAPAHRSCGASLITLLCLYANVIILLLITSTWLPDIHYLRGLWYGFLFVSGVLAIGFIGRLIKRDISISVMVYYLLGWVSTVLVHVLTQVQWSQEVQSVL